MISVFNYPNLISSQSLTGAEVESQKISDLSFHQYGNHLCLRGTITRNFIRWHARLRPILKACALPRKIEKYQSSMETHWSSKKQRLMNIQKRVSHSLDLLHEFYALNLTSPFFVRKMRSWAHSTMSISKFTQIIQAIKFATRISRKCSFLRSLSFLTDQKMACL